MGEYLQEIVSAAVVNPRRGYPDPITQPSEKKEEIPHGRAMPGACGAADISHKKGRQMSLYSKNGEQISRESNQTASMLKTSLILRNFLSYLGFLGIMH
jgi:hypothetical protein